MTRLYDTIKTVANRCTCNNTHTHSFKEKEKFGNKVLKNKEIFTQEKVTSFGKGERD
jgi:hypothetical protein